MIVFLRKRATGFGTATLAVALLLSACSQASTSASSVGSPSAHATSDPLAASPSAAASRGAPHVGTQSIPGIGAVLVNGKGLTLYHLTTDTSATTTCTGGCAQIWPPLLTTNGNPPPSPASMGTFGTINRPDGGAQVTFNGMPLYTYAGDSRPGEASGQGISGTWFAVTS